MKKILLAVMFLSSCGPAMAEELRPQFRTWRSSAVTATLNPILLSSSPIIFHMIQGSGTVANQGNAYFSLWRSTMFAGSLFANAHTTAAFVPLNSSNLIGSPIQNGIGSPWDIHVDSNVSYTSQGGAANTLFILYDFYKEPVKDPSPRRDTNDIMIRK